LLLAGPFNQMEDPQQTVYNISYKQNEKQEKKGNFIQFLITNLTIQE